MVKDEPNLENSKIVKKFNELIGVLALGTLILLSGVYSLITETAILSYKIFGLLHFIRLEKEQLVLVQIFGTFLVIVGLASWVMAYGIYNEMKKIVART
ncbi:MAG: hypothetical protein Q7S22_00270 [Candidatus Micrarchaeota archaeon]|nr:hypothetical protein [Candidatus Micrarchaeota archaeon]